MSKRKANIDMQPFPVRRPDITIRPSRAKPFAVDCRETPGWFGIPEVGDCTFWSTYDPPDWRRTGATRMRGIRPARVHELECVELEVRAWEPGKGWKTGEGMTFARVSKDRVQWVAYCPVQNGERRIYTFLDKGFDSDWGDAPRKLKDSTRLISQEDGSYKLKKAGECGWHGTFGAGVFRVTVGARAFTCLRVIDLYGAPSEKGKLYVSYMTKQGRTVLGRRYNGRQWGRKPGWPYAEKPPWDERFPDNDRMVIDGVMYVHWYDCLSGLAVGVSATGRRE